MSTNLLNSDSESSSPDKVSSCFTRFAASLCTIHLQQLVQNDNIKGRRSLRDLPSRTANIYPKLPNSAMAQLDETNRSPMRGNEVDQSSMIDDGLDESDENSDENVDPNSIHKVVKNVRIESDARRSPSRQETPKRFKISAPSSSREKPRVEDKIHWRWIFLVSIVFACFAAFCFSGNNSDLDSDAVIKTGQINCSKFMELESEFPNQDRKLFKSLKTGIEGTVNGKPPVPSVFSLFSTDAELRERILKEVIKVTMRCINQKQDPIELHKEHLSSKLVQDYKDELMKRKIMIIHNVDEASPEAVTSLHSFCDTYSPLWPNSIIFLTMTVPRAPSGKPVEYISEYLNEKWKSLAENIRAPLITRILDQTFFIKP